jgi:polysaccharide deacetylase family protein (PEP-CTERM system associated)
MLNALTFDVEDGWSVVSRDQHLGDIEPAETVVGDTERILGILAARNTKATFVVVGKVAEKFPSLIKRIASAGHELGIHSYSHRQMFRLTENEFRNDVKRAKAAVENSASAEVKGYRAPEFSISPRTKWSLRILAEEGFRYDSSVVPCSNPRYGLEGFSKDICRVDVGDGLCIVEVPLSVFSIPMTNKGFLTGGGYLRHFPYCVSHAVIRHIQKTRPVIVYMHPYEFGEETVSLPMEQLSTMSRLKMRLLACWCLGMGIGNRRTMAAKLEELLSACNFGPMGYIVDQRLGRQT